MTPAACLERKQQEEARKQSSSARLLPLLLVVRARRAVVSWEGEAPYIPVVRSEEDEGLMVATERSRLGQAREPKRRAAGLRSETPCSS